MMFKETTWSSRLLLGAVSLGRRFLHCWACSHAIDSIRSHREPCFLGLGHSKRAVCASAKISLKNCWYGRVVLLFHIRVKTDEKDRNGRSVLMDCDCAMCTPHMNNMQTECKPKVFCPQEHPSWWREAGESGTRQLYQPEPRPVTVVYIIPSPPSWEGCLSSLRETTAPSLL
jgi:hypothetical protein